jgi:tRNA G26 N,N-dimethylase Trm1
MLINDLGILGMTKEEERDNIGVKLRDSTELMISQRANGHPLFDIIDLDPYGSSLPYLMPAMSSIRHAGMICTTFTDLKVLGS